MKTIDPNSPVPLYYQLKEMIIYGINTGKWTVGDLIPSENQLSKLYSVSRNTAQKALEELVHDGILTRKQGVGTFVAAPKIEQALSGFYSFSEAMQARGYKHTVKVIGLAVVGAKKKQADALGIKEGAPVIELIRLRFVDDVPFVKETSNIPQNMAEGLEKYDFEKNSLYKTLLTTYQIYVVKARETFEPVLINSQESELLNVEEGSPAILLHRIAYSSNDVPVEFCKSIIPGSKCRFYTELR